MDCWTVLGISPTTDKKVIEDAYFQLLENAQAESELNSFQRINNAYKSALLYASEQRESQQNKENQQGDAIPSNSPASTLAVENDHGKHSSQTDEQTNSFNKAPKRLSLVRRISYNFVVLAVLLGAYWAYGAYKEGQRVEQQQKIMAKQLEARKNAWDERVLACNQIFNAQPTEAFNTCEELAKEGNVQAQQRILWAYSRAGDYLDWQQVFNYLQAVKRKNEDALLLFYSLMKMMGNTTELTTTGEKGIIKLVNRNFPAANIMLAVIYELEENQLPVTSNSLWLIERAIEKDPELIDATEIAFIHASGLLQPANYDKAKGYLDQFAEQNFPISTNNVAWFLSTLENNPITSSDYALSLAKKVVDEPEFADSFVYVDTLAATYAANGQFELAVETQEKAIQLLTSAEVNESRKEFELQEFESRLQNYKDNQPAVTATLDLSKERYFTSLRTRLMNVLLDKFFVTIEKPDFEIPSTENQSN